MSTILNSVSLVGRLVRDPECSYTTSGIAVAKYTVAVDRFTKNAETGERETDFIPCVCFRKTAEFVTQYIQKGRLVGITGRIQVRSWVTQEDEKRWMTEVIAEHVQGLDRPKQDAHADPRPDAAADGDISDPFADE